ncbi:MAG TPA: ABC transporter substrate-binding protein [bacterium]|nr:ABC transporter substrate-binding protein [bacterium]
MTMHRLQRMGTAVATRVLLVALACALTATTARSAGAPGGALRIAQGIYPETFNAERSTVQDTLNVDSQINEPLMNFNYKTHEIMPNLATSWKLTSPTTWTIEVRQGVMFTNGEAFNAEVAAWNVNWVLDPANKAPISTDLALAQSAKATGPYTLEVTTKQAFPNLPLALTRVFVLPQKYYESVGADGFAKHPVGTGPYEFVNATNGQDVVLRANPNYWGRAPQIGTVTFYSITQTVQRVNALKTGEVEIVNHLTPDLLQLVTSQPTLTVSAIPSLRLMFVILDTTKPGPLQNNKVRLALNYAVDKQAIVRDLLRGYGKPLQGQPLSPEYFGFDQTISAFPYDPARAKQMLAEAGSPASSLHLEFYAPQGRYTSDAEVAKAIAGQLQSLGIQVDLHVFDWGTFIGQFVQKKLGPMIFIGYSTQPDADIALGVERCGQAYSYFCSTDYDALLNRADRTLDTPGRLALYKQAALIMHNTAPYIYLYQEYTIWGVSKRVQGFTTLPDERVDLSGVSVH